MIVIHTTTICQPKTKRGLILWPWFSFLGNDDFTLFESIILYSSKALTTKLNCATKVNRRELFSLKNQSRNEPWSRKKKGVSVPCMSGNCTVCWRRKKSCNQRNDESWINLERSLDAARGAFFKLFRSLPNSFPAHCLDTLRWNMFKNKHAFWYLEALEKRLQIPFRPNFGVCSGCHFQNASESLLALKCFKKRNSGSFRKTDICGGRALWKSIPRAEIVLHFFVTKK